jgi:transitional endoplasmic reticulum ATPase
MNDIHKTISALLEALQFSPNNIRLQKHVAELLLQSGRDEEAIPHWLDIYKQTEDPECLLHLGKAYYNIKKFADAKRVLFLRRYSPYKLVKRPRSPGNCSS